MLQFFEQIKEACQQHRERHARGEQSNTGEEALSLKLLLRRLRADVRHTRTAASPASALHGDAPLPEQPQPLLYPTPDGALRSISARHKRTPVIASLTGESTAATPSSAPDGLQEGQRDSTSPDARTPAPPAARAAEEAVTSDAVLFSRGARNTAAASRQQTSSSAAVDEGLMEMLISISTSTTIDGEREEGIFTLGERVEALYTLVYMTCYPGNGWRSEFERLEAEGGCGCRESLICKIDLLQLAATACNMLKCVMEQLMGRVGSGTFSDSRAAAEEEEEDDAKWKKDHDDDDDDDDGDEQRQLLQSLVDIANTMTILLGCRNPRHWQSEEITHEAVEPHVDASQVAASFFPMSLEPERGCCLCCSAGPLTYQFMMTALTENGLWQYMWRFVALPFLSRSEHNAENKETPKMRETSDDAYGYNGTARTFGVRLMLKMMVLLLLRSASAGDQDLSSILCSPSSEEEEELGRSCCRAFAPLRTDNNDPQLSSMERRLLFTLRQLSRFLVFRHVSCYAANTMHVLLTRLLVSPALANVNVQLLLESLFFAGESPLLPPPAHPNDNANAAYLWAPPSKATVSLVLSRVLHALSFHIALHRNESSGQVPKRHINRNTATATTNTSCDLVVPGALLTVLLLLEQQQQQQQPKRRWPLESMMAHHAAYKKCEESAWLQAALSAGLSRTHQVALLLYAAAAHDAATRTTTAAPQPPTSPPLLTLRLEGPHVTAFSQLVRPNPPTPSALQRKNVDAEMWAESLRILVHSTAAIGASSAAARRKKSQTSLTCTLTCPLRPISVEGCHGVCRSGKTHQWAATGKEHSRGQFLQVYVKVPSSEKTAIEGGGGGGGGRSNGAVKAAGVAGANLVSNSFLTPMVFGNGPVACNDRMRAGSCRDRSGSNNTMPTTPSSPLRKMGCRVDTFFANREMTEYARVADNVPCTSLLRRETMEYSAVVEMIILTTSRDEEEETEPLCAAILACCTTHGDKLHLWSQPPRKSSAAGGQEEQAKSPERIQSQLGAAVAAARRKQSSCSLNPKSGAIALCSVSRHDGDVEGDTTTGVTATAVVPSPLDVTSPNNPPAYGRTVPPGGASPSHASNANEPVIRVEHQRNSDDDSDDFAEINAYVANLKPTPIVDTILVRKDQEIALLQQQLEHAQAQESFLEQRLHEALAQREELLGLLEDRRVELELCHSDIIAPLRREVTLLRQSLTLRNREAGMAISLCRKLRSENIVLAESIHTIRCEMVCVMKEA
ncbi:hypothetical protein DQ04_10091010 [Trypanosoma grayi]|uniref:hypothetical protein n=1 Tax=Trypanosoma grayi TaxID=71804 RepID=UPI0004F4923F|nr:hypothetical protein DQ04_10091010 [Trypanosoma grayi]KEG07348.1 hypothetical protein DQ04_10091010 [Trypanosoma grayi]